MQSSFDKNPNAIFLNFKLIAFELIVRFIMFYVSFDMNMQLSEHFNFYRYIFVKII